MDKRYIEDYEFWKQNDKDKNRRRKVMVQKLFKGRKNPKPKPLTAKLEKKLKKMILILFIILNNPMKMKKKMRRKTIKKKRKKKS